MWPRVMAVDENDGRLLGEVTGIKGAHGAAIVAADGRGFATAGEGKEIVLSTLVNIADAVLAEGLATESELDSTIEELDKYTKNPSTILGQLLSNGRVFLINPSGIAPQLTSRNGPPLRAEA